MGRLIYTGITSLDGYVADENGEFDWSMPDDDVHAFINDLERPISTHLYGRRLYDVLDVWETIDTSAAPGSVFADYASVWRAATKIVFSTTLDAPRTTRTEIRRSFEPAEIRELVAASPTDVAIGGSTLAAQALAAGLVDEIHQFINPVTVGGGLPFLPPGVKLKLALVSSRSFASGVVHVHYRAA